MNWSDFAVVVIICGFGLLGYSSGLMLSIFRLGSVFLSAILAVKLYPILSQILMKTAIFTSIRTSIFNRLILQQPGIDNQGKQVIGDTIVDGLKLPSFLKTTVEKSIPNLSSIFDFRDLIGKISDNLAGVVINIISLILLFVVVRIVIIFLRYIIKGISKLPVIKQADKLGGFAFGAFEGLLTVYIVLALVMLFNASQIFKGIYTAVDSSIIAKFFYQNNFIINWMFPK